MLAGRPRSGSAATPLLEGAIESLEEASRKRERQTLAARPAIPLLASCSDAERSTARIVERTDSVVKWGPERSSAEPWSLVLAARAA